MQTCGAGRGTSSRSLRTRDAALAAGEGPRHLQGRAWPDRRADRDAGSMGGTRRHRRRRIGSARRASVHRRLAAWHTRSGRSRPNSAWTLPAEGGDMFRNFVLPVPLGGRAIRACDRDPPGQRPHPPSRQRPPRIAAALGRQRDAAEPGAGFAGMDLEIASDRFEPDSHFLFWKPGTPAEADVEDHSVGDRAGDRPDPQPASAHVGQAGGGAPVAGALLHRPGAYRVPDAAAARARRRARHSRGRRQLHGDR